MNATRANGGTWGREWRANQATTGRHLPDRGQAAGTGERRDAGVGMATMATITYRIAASGFVHS